MDERFVPLATIVRAAARAPATHRAEPAVSASDAISARPILHEVAAFAHADVVNEIALMRLAALEAFQAGTTRMLRSFASDVLGRELLLGPADIDVLCERALAAFVEHEPASIAVSTADAQRVRAPLPVRVDPSLEPGDLIVDVRDGAFESRFTFRLQDALDRAARSSGAA